MKLLLEKNNESKYFTQKNRAVDFWEVPKIT